MTIKSKSVKKIPRKAPPIYYLHDSSMIEAKLPLSNCNTISPSYKIPSTPELRSSRSSISSIESHASASSQSPPEKPTKSPSRSKVAKAKTQVKLRVHTSGDGMFDFGGTVQSPMEEVRSLEDVDEREFEIKSRNKSFLPSTPRRSSSKRQGGMWFV